MTNRYILYAGHRDVCIETRLSAPAKDMTFATGAQEIFGNEIVSYSDHKGLVGSWGRHWPVNDTIKYTKETIGIATYIPKQYIVKEANSEKNLLYVISGHGKPYFHYYTMFTSRKETFGFKDSAEWFAYMEEWERQLNEKLSIKIIRD